MATSKTVICNQALYHLGSSKEIANVETEKSKEAQACRRFFEQARDEMLRGFSWPFASKTAALGLVTADPTSEWAYAYRYPSDCLYARKILSGTRNDTRQSRVPYRFSQDEQGTLIFTDKQDAELEYTATSENVLRYPPDFVAALAFKLAAYIAPSITGGDPFKLGALSLQMHAMAGQTAMSAALNEEQAEEAPDSEFIRARE